MNEGIITRESRAYYYGVCIGLGIALFLTDLIFFATWFGGNI